MNHFGELLKNHIETNHIKKRDVAEAVGISCNYLSTIFTKSSIDAELLEKLCIASGLPVASVFSAPTGGPVTTMSDIHQTTVIGSPSISVNDYTMLQKILDEKERVIKILIAASGLNIESK